ncbi:AMP-binding protein [Streptomyces sp. NPDC056188]|uniref:AMP-binding protein n=1 Tax=Streptomyces sp. NPDC056188 TaxID=3345740 RepID=UPI0035DDFB94
MSDEKDWVAVTDLLLVRAERFPDRVAMNVNGTGGITYWEWQRRVNRTANGLLRAGVRRGDAIAPLFGGMDWIDYAVVACLAVLSAGACGVHLHESYPQAELERRLAEGGVIHGAALRPPRRVGAWARARSRTSTAATRRRSRWTSPLATSPTSSTPPARPGLRRDSPTRTGTSPSAAAPRACASSRSRPRCPPRCHSAPRPAPGRWRWP